MVYLYSIRICVGYILVLEIRVVVVVRDNDEQVVAVLVVVVVVVVVRTCST